VNSCLVILQGASLTESYLAPAIVSKDQGISNRRAEEILPKDLPQAQLRPSHCPDCTATAQNTKL
jgi:hypothetical protein